MIRSILFSAAFLATSAVSSFAATYQYVGAWNVADGPLWSARNAAGDFTTGIYTGQEAAALIFGGSASDYAISTVSDMVSDINFSAWMDGWGDPDTYGPNGAPAPQDFKFDVNGDGLYAEPSGIGNSYSAYVNDHASDFLNVSNYAFRIMDTDTVAPVPLPAGLPLMVFGVGGLFALRRSRKAA